MIEIASKGKNRQEKRRNKSSTKRFGTCAGRRDRGKRGKEFDGNPVLLLLTGGKGKSKSPFGAVTQVKRTTRRLVSGRKGGEGNNRQKRAKISRISKSQGENAEDTNQGRTEMVRQYEGGQVPVKRKGSRLRKVVRKGRRTERTPKLENERMQHSHRRGKNRSYGSGEGGER